VKIYYYHTQDIQRIWREWNDGRFPGHFLYGATHFREHGIEMVMHKHNPTKKHWRITLDTTWKILTCKEKFDLVYGTSFRGLEGIIFLRALRLFRRPVIIWHHQPIVKAKNPLREMIARLFYKGIDEMFFFSQKLVDDSLKSVKADKKRMHIAHWGPDLDFYDRLMAENGNVSREGFISTGKECRDYVTLIKAFATTGSKLELYLNHTNGSINYDKLLEGIGIPSNIDAKYICTLMPTELAKRVNKAKCVAVCCMPTNYTVGLTTVVEAMALGLPLICSRNPQMPMDIDKTGCGITVNYYDYDGWVEAIQRIENNPEEAKKMGISGRKAAEDTFNIKICTREVADVIQKYKKQ